MNLKGVNVGGQKLARGVKVLLMVEGGVVLGDLSHVGQGKVGQPGVRMTVPEF